MFNEKTMRWILIIIGIFLIVNSMGMFRQTPIESQNIITDLNEQCDLTQLNSTQLLECASDVTIANFKKIPLGYIIAGIVILIIGLVGFKKR